jgi:hypothetical protein
MQSPLTLALLKPDVAAHPHRLSALLALLDGHGLVRLREKASGGGWHLLPGLGLGLPVLLQRLQLDQGMAAAFYAEHHGAPLGTRVRLGGLKPLCSHGTWTWASHILL